MRVQSSKQRGFSLIELMVVVAIIAILATIAYPGYTRYVQNTHQASTQGEMMAAVAQAEAWRSQNFTYNGFTLPDPLANSDRYNVVLNIAADGLSFDISAQPLANMAGTGAMAINNRNQTCIDKNNDSACVFGGTSWK